MFREITEEEYRAEAKPNKVVIERMMSIKSLDVPTMEVIDRTLDEVIDNYILENFHADYLKATIVVGSKKVFSGMTMDGNNASMPTPKYSSYPETVVKYFKHIHKEEK